MNTGCREQEVCKLQSDWEIAVPELETSVFLIPAGFGGRSAKAISNAATTTRSCFRSASLIKKGKRRRLTA